MLTLQMDIYSTLDRELAQRFAYAIDHAARPDAELRQAADLLRSWDGVMAADSAPAAIIYSARDQLWPMLLKPRIGEDWKLYQWPESTFVQEEFVTHRPPQWLPPGYANWDDFLAAVVKQGLTEHHAPSDLKTWRFGDVRRIDIEHPLYGMLPWFKKWTGIGSHPQSGDGSTIKQMTPTLGPSQRLTVDWSNLDTSTENTVLGQSGNPMSPWYRDQWPYWYGGSTFGLPFSEGAVTAATKHTLRLTP